MERVNRKELVLAALAPAGESPHEPVQLQKLLFLIDSNVGKRLGGPYFNFEPYDYGPFDKAVYSMMDSLERDGYVEVEEVPGRHWSRYRLTETGHERAQRALAKLSEPMQQYFRDLSRFVRSRSFAKLVSAIYRQYPEMKVNSVFQE